MRRRLMGARVLFAANAYGEKCRTNEDCLRIDEHMECSPAEARTCRCQRGLLWDEASRRCYLLDDTSFYMFSSLNGVEPRAPPALSPSQQFPLHPTPCMGLFLPAGSLAPPPAPAAAAAAVSPPS